MKKSSVERELEDILTEWNQKDGKVSCTYLESQLLIEFLIGMESPFKVSYTDLDRILIERWLK